MESETRSSGIAVVRPAGVLTGESACTVKEEVRLLLAGGKDVVIDLGDVPFTDSEGLSSLVALFKSASLASRRMALSSLRPNLRALLELTRLHRIFEVYDDVETAESAVREGGPAEAVVREGTS